MHNPYRHTKTDSLPEADEDIIADVCDRMKNGEVCPKPLDIVSFIASRIYTEACMSREYIWQMGNSYTGEPYDRWIRDETHFAMCRAGFTWDKEQGRFSGDVAAMYQQVRTTVLRAAALRAIALHDEWKDGIPPDDRRNLRGKDGLQPYVERAVLMGAAA